MCKRELGRYAPKKTKTGRSPANVGDLAALHHLVGEAIYCRYGAVYKAKICDHYSRIIV